MIFILWLKSHCDIRFLRFSCALLILCAIVRSGQGSGFLKTCGQVVEYTSNRSRTDAAQGIHILLGSRYMSGKKSIAYDSHDEKTPRPIALLVAVIFAAGVSTWHWYRPLPQKATIVSNGPFVSQTEAAVSSETPRFKSKWKDAGLVFPSDETDITGSPPANNEPLGTANQGSMANPSSSLTGKGELALQPFREATQPLKQSIAQMPLPMVPVKPTQDGSPPSPSEARLWNATKKQPESVTDNAMKTIEKLADSPVRSLDTFESASPFRVPRVDSEPRPQTPVASMKSDIWPDQGYQPGATSSNHSAMATNQQASSAAESTPLMSLSSNRIRTLDRESEISIPQKISSPVSPSTASSRGSHPIEKGSVIRQPPSKTPIKE